MNNLQHLHCDDCVNWLCTKSTRIWDTIFADPPDNIGLKYAGYKDKLLDDEYVSLLNQWLRLFIDRANCVWFSYNAKWWAEIGRIVTALKAEQGACIEIRHCIQIFSFGQHRQTDLGNNYRPLLRIMQKDAPLYPDDIRVPSWRQEHGDKRADPRGRVPGDVFDFPRVTGNSRQRRSYHPTQLNEGLVKRCIKLTTSEGGDVLDPFAGTGTTLRVCKQINRNCTLVEVDPFYCEQIAKEHELVSVSKHEWRNE